MEKNYAAALAIALALVSSKAMAFGHFVCNTPDNKYIVEYGGYKNPSYPLKATIEVNHVRYDMDRAKLGPQAVRLSGNQMQLTILFPSGRDYLRIQYLFEINGSSYDLTCMGVRGQG